MSSTLWSAKIPFPPSVNGGYYENRKTFAPKFLASGKVNPRAGKAYVGRMISIEGIAFRQEVHAIARRGHVAPPFLKGRLDLLVLLCAPAEKADGTANRNRRDLDNYFKPLQDALTRAKVISDDSLFDRVEMVRGQSVGRGEAYVLISRFDPEHVRRASAIFFPHEPARDLLST